jgi:hypothetical protein
MRHPTASDWRGGVISRLRGEAHRIKRHIVREPEVIVVDTHGGLGNKLKALVSAMRLSDTVAATYPTFGVLFENEIPVVETIPAKCRVFSDWRFVLAPNDRLPDDFASVPIPERGQSVLGIPVGRSIDLEYERVPAHLRDSFLEAFAKLRIRDEIEHAVARVTDRWPRDTIAVHVRSWVENDSRRNAFFDLERFFHEVDERGDVPIFLGSDAAEVLEEFRRKYGSRVITVSDDDTAVSHSARWDDEEVVVRAFIDMLCLSRSDVLIGSYLSTFTECAWWLGGCRQEVVIL